MEYDGTHYLYRKNFFGDITAIYNTSGTCVAKYAYDAYGVCKVMNPDGTENTDDDFIGNVNPIRYRGYYYDVGTGFYYLQTRYYDPQTGRFLNIDGLEYLDPETVGGLNLYAYCNCNPVMYVDPDGTTWWKWVIGAVAVATLVAATILTFGAAGPAAATVGSAMLAGGLASGSINLIDQLHDKGEVDWTEVAISTISGSAYGLAVATTGGAAAGTWSWSGFAAKLAVAGGTSLLNSLNNADGNINIKDTLFTLGVDLLKSTLFQVAGFGAGKLMSVLPKSTSQIMTIGDIGSALWDIPAVKAGVIRFFSGLTGAIINDFRR